MHRLLMIGLATTALGAAPVFAQTSATAVAQRHGMIGMHGRPMIHHRPQVHHRIHRGAHIGRHWFGPRVHLRNYALYGLTPPAYGDRWVRYYDDAVLIDRDGRVRDSRAGLDWDVYGERWDDEDGIPAYHRDDEDDRWDDRYDDRRYDDRDYDDFDGRAEYPAGRSMTTRFEGHRPIEGYYPPGTVITETVVTTAPTVHTETYYVTGPATRQRTKLRRTYRPKPTCDCAPHPGERG